MMSTQASKADRPRAKRCFLTPAMLSLALLLPPIGGQAQVALVEVGSIVISVSDLDRSVAFYTEVLSFRKIDATEGRLDSFDRLTGIFGTNVRVATLQLGAESIQLIQYRTPRGRPVPPDAKSNDQWFQHIAIVVSDMDEASARLTQYRVQQISTAPQTLPEWNKNAAGIKAFYFRDPDDHPLELIYFPPSKRDPRWQQSKVRCSSGLITPRSPSRTRSGAFGSTAICLDFAWSAKA